MKRRALTLLALVALGVAWSAPSAQAHALLKSSVPTDGALLQKPPSQVVLTFTEPPDPKLSSVEVLDQSGTTVGSGDLQVVPGQANTLALQLPELPTGVYTVSWRVVSRADGHLTSGAFSFGVGVKPEPVSGSGTGGTVGSSPSPPALGVAGRWAFYWGIALLLGGAVAGLLVVGRLPRRGPAVLALAWLLAALGLIAMFQAERSAIGASVGDLLRSGRGHLLEARAIALAVTGLAVALVLWRRGRIPLSILGVATLATMGVHAYAGHAGATGSWRWFNVGDQWLHIVAVGVWVGGLGWLLLSIVGEPTPDEPQSIKRFSLIAGYALVVVAVTGVFRAIDEVGFSFGRLVHAAFGLTVLGKVAGFLGLATLGAINRVRLIPGMNPSGGRALLSMRRVVGGELLLAAGVFGLTGLMTELSPPAQAIAAQKGAPQQIVATGHDFATTVRVRLEVNPGTPGPNTFTADISDYDTGQPVSARKVTLRFALPDRPDIGTSELELDGQADGRWTGQGTNLSVTGTWRVGVLIEQAANSLEVSLEVKTRAPPQTITIVPGNPPIYRIDLPSGESVQAYLDPGNPGANELHFTFFTAAGGELPIADVTMSATSPSGTREEPKPRRLSKGHFVASVRLDAATWTFSADATAEDGTPLSVHFEQEIKG